MQKRYTEEEIIKISKRTPAQIELEEMEMQKAGDEAKKSPFREFIQINDELYAETGALQRNYPTASFILNFLIHAMDGKNNIMISWQAMQEGLGYSKSTIARAIDTLKKFNFIRIFKSGGANIYSINRRIAWKSWGTNYEYASFDAKIILAKSEQPQEELDDEIIFVAEKIKNITVKPKNQKNKTKLTAKIEKNTTYKPIQLLKDKTIKDVLK